MIQPVLKVQRGSILEVRGIKKFAILVVTKAQRHHAAAAWLPG